MYKGSVIYGGVVRRSGVVLLVVERGSIFGLLVDGSALVFFGQEFFDLPVVLLDADREFEIFAGDGVPVLFLERLAELVPVGFCGATTNLIYHHDCEQIANGCKDETIQVVLHVVADGVAEDIQNDLANDEEEDAERNVA